MPFAFTVFVTGAAALARSSEPVDLSQDARGRDTGPSLARRSDAHAQAAQDDSSVSPDASSFFNEEVFPGSVYTVTTVQRNFSFMERTPWTHWPVPANCQHPTTQSGEAVDPETTVLAEPFRAGSRWSEPTICTLADGTATEMRVRSYNLGGQHFYEVEDLGFTRVGGPNGIRQLVASEPRVSCSFVAGDPSLHSGALRVLSWRQERVLTICREPHVHSEELSVDEIAQVVAAEAFAMGLCLVSMTRLYARLYGAARAQPAQPGAVPQAVQPVPDDGSVAIHV